MKLIEKGVLDEYIATVENVLQMTYFHDCGSRVYHVDDNSLQQLQKMHMIFTGRFIDIDSRKTNDGTTEDVRIP